MFGSSGFFLPETLHRRDDSTLPAQTAGDVRAVKYFQKTSGRPKREGSILEEPHSNSRSSTSRLSTNAPREATEDDKNHLSCMTTAYDFADFVFSLSKASPEVVSLASLIRDIRGDIAETARLKLSEAVSNSLEDWPDQTSRIDEALFEVRRALNNVGQEIDAARVSGGDGGALAARRRFEWTARNAKKLLKKQQPLIKTYNDLRPPIAAMQTMERLSLPGGTTLGPIYEAPVRPWLHVDGRVALRGPYSRQKYRLSQTNLSTSTLTLPEPDRNLTDANSRYSLPAELPGSTPDDLAQSRFLEAQTSPITRRSSYDDPHERTTTLRRSPAYPDQMRPLSPTITKSRASTDGMKPLSMLAEKTMERNDSTTSTTATVMVPQVAKKYRSSTINIRYPTRPQSDPILPYIESSPSLVDEMRGVINGWTGEKLESRERATSRVSAPQTMSIASQSTTAPTTTSVLVDPSNGFIVTQAEPTAVLDSVDVELAIDSEPFPNSENNNNAPKSPSEAEETPSSTHSTDIAREYAISLQYSESSVSRKPLPQNASTIFLQNICADNVCTNSDFLRPTQTSITKSVALSSISQASQSKSTILPTRQRTLRPAGRIQVVNSDVELSLIQQKMLAQDYRNATDARIATTPTPTDATPTDEPKDFSATSVETTPQSKQPMSSPPTSPSADLVADFSTPSDMVTSTSMSTQAKRRAAHARRMKLAFGEAA